MMMPAASSARPMIWPPVRREPGGNNPGAPLILAGAGGGDAFGPGEIFGKARAGFATGPGRAGSVPGANAPWGSGPRLRTDSWATVMMKPTASTARPMIWPPVRRESSGNNPDAPLTPADAPLTPAGAGDGDAFGPGEIFGKARAGFATGPGRAGSVPGANASWGSSVPAGSAAPTPTAVGTVPAGAAAGVGSAVTRTLPEADAEAAACGEVPAAVKVIWVPAAFFGTATAARNSTGWPAVSPAGQAAPPDDEQTVNLGASLPGFAVMVIFAVPLALPASETQIA
jgi:hypothetical protein